eukprot:2229029-Amphidinium_carterae.1
MALQPYTTTTSFTTITISSSTTTDTTTSSSTTTYTTNALISHIPTKVWASIETTDAITINLFYIDVLNYSFHIKQHKHVNDIVNEPCLRISNSDRCSMFIARCLAMWSN